MHFSISVKGMPFFVFLKKFPTFLREYAEIRRQAEKAGDDFPFAKLYPCLEEKDEESGVIAEHYFLQDLLVAQKIYQMNSPSRHVDIGSRIDGFVGHVASFREVEIFDVRGQKLDIDTFSYINNENRLITNAVLDERSVGNNFGCNYGCGIFELTKR